MKKLIVLSLSLIAVLIISACNPGEEVDETAPVITVDTSLQTTFEYGSSEPDWTTYITATDDVDGDITITAAMVNDDNVDMNRVGSFFVLFTVRDEAGNKALKTIDINITDTTDPVITIDSTKPTEFEVGSNAPDFTTYVTVLDNVDGEIDVTTAMIDTTSVDMDTVGAFDVIYTVDDYRGNETSETVTFTIVDTTDPVITQSGQAQTELVSGTAEPDWTTYVTATDNYDGEIAITSAMVDDSNVDMATVGTFDVVFTVTDANGNSATLTITMTITQNDETAPIITQNPAAELELDLDAAEPDWTTYVTATDNLDGDIAITSAMVDASAVDMTTEGDYDVVFTVSDTAGNERTLTITVTVRIPDTTAPVLSLTDDAESTFVIGSTSPDWTTFITATDDLDGTITITSAMVDATAVNFDALGEYDVIFTVSDAAGNEATLTYTIYIVEDVDYDVNNEVFHYPFDVGDAGNLALPNLLEGNGYLINNEGYAETIYMDGANPVFGYADSWTFVSAGYDWGIEEYVIETAVTAIGFQNPDSSPVFSIRIDYDWLLDIHFSFNNNSWTGIAIYNLPGGPAYNTDPATGGLVTDLKLALDQEYVFKVVVLDSIYEDMDLLRIYVDGRKVMELDVPEINANAQFIFGASQGSHIKTDYFKANEISIPYDLYTVTGEAFSYPFDAADSGNLALPNLLEGNGYLVNDDGQAETIYMDGATPVFGFADAWTFVSTGYDLGLEEYAIEATVTAVGHQNTDTSPIFSIRIDYDWLMDVHFNFNNNSWSGVAVHNLPGGSAYSNDAAAGGLAPNLNMDLNTAYRFKVVVLDGMVAGEDTLIIYVDDQMVMKRQVPEINANAQFIFGASQGSHIKVDEFRADNVQGTDFTLSYEQFNYAFDPADSGNLALPNLLEGNGYLVNDDGQAETIYMDGATSVFGYADAWTFVSTGYDLGLEEYVIEATVMAVGHQNTDTSPIFSIRIDYDWLMDVHFNFNNNSWSGVAVHNLPGGSAYSNDPEAGGLAPSLNMDLNTAYRLRIVVLDGDVVDEDTVMIFVDDLKVMELQVPDINANAQFIFGASQGSHIKVDYFKANLVDIVN